MNINRSIFEIVKTDQPSFSGGEYAVPSRDGGKIMSSQDGYVSVQFLQDADGTWRQIKVNGSEEWDNPAVIRKIRDHSDTTVDIANLLIGMGR